MSKNKKMQLDRARLRAEQAQLRVKIAHGIARTMRHCNTLADALARYDDEIGQRLEERLPRPSPTAVAHALAFAPPSWWSEFRTDMLRTPAREKRRTQALVAGTMRAAAASVGEPELAERYLHPGIRVDEKPNGEFTLVARPQTQAEENRAVLDGGGAPREEKLTLADVAVASKSPRVPRGLGYQFRTVVKSHGPVYQCWVRGRDGQECWAEVGENLVVVYSQPLPVTMHRSDREALAQWALVRDTSGETTNESVYETILSQIHDLLWDEKNRISYAELPALVRELEDKAAKYDATQKPDGEFVLVPRASFNDLKRQAGVVETAADESTLIEQWQALGQRWLDHYFDVAQRNPEARAGAKGAIAALQNLLRKDEPPNWQLQDRIEARVGNTTFLATSGMQADEQFVLFKTAPAGEEAAGVRTPQSADGHCDDRVSDAESRSTTAPSGAELAPVPLLLSCPTCGERHVDAGAFATKPHHTHACQFCGMTWRPAIVHTVGVLFLPGFKNDDERPR